MEYGCRNCNRGRNSRKMKPYGAQPGKFWCSTCDADLVSKTSKKTVRQESKKLIEKEMDDELRVRSQSKD